MISFLKKWWLLIAFLAVVAAVFLWAFGWQPPFFGGKKLSPTQKAIKAKAAAIAHKDSVDRGLISAEPQEELVPLTPPTLDEIVAQLAPKIAAELSPLLDEKIKAVVAAAPKPASSRAVADAVESRLSTRLEQLKQAAHDNLVASNKAAERAGQAAINSADATELLRVLRGGLEASASAVEGSRRSSGFLGLGSRPTESSRAANAFLRAMAVADSSATN